jgi:enoyl-CoA hydratase/carnithine racemase
LTVPLRLIAHEGDWLECILNRPHTKNAIDDGMLVSLDQALRQRRWRAIVIHGEQGNFCSGYDLKELAQWTRRPKAALPDKKLGQVFRRLERHPSPTIAAVEGVCFGAGLELACACDFRLATPDSVFCMPPAKLGIVYAADGMARVAQKAGLQTARWLFLTASKMSADEAERRGLVDMCCDTPLEAATSLAQHLLTLSDTSLRAMKRSLAALSSVPVSKRDTALRRQGFLGSRLHVHLKHFDSAQPPKRVQKP